MEYEIEESLFDIYTNIKIEVEYVEVRKYKIKIKSEHIKDEFIYTYDAHLTFDNNIHIITLTIDKKILSYYKTNNI